MSDLTMSSEEFQDSFDSGRREFIGVTINGDIVLPSEQVDTLFFPAATIDGDVYLDNMRCSEKLIFTDATITGSLFLRGIEICGIIYATGLKVTEVFCGENFALAQRMHMALPGTPVHFDHNPLEELLKKITED